MKKLLIILSCVALSISQANAKEHFKYRKLAPVTTIHNNIYDKSFTDLRDEMKKERLAISNALQLSEEQAKLRDDLVKNTSQILNDKFHNLYLEKTNLKMLKYENAPAQAIKEQEKKVDALCNEIGDIIKQENKDYKKILDHPQRSKLRMIEKLQRKTLKDAKKQKDYKKYNPKMREFAPKRI